MPVHILIDGYNLIRQSQFLGRAESRSLEEGREALIESLADYKKVKAYPITVVFDAADADVYTGRKIRIKGIDVRFSRPGESADLAIKRMVAREGGRAIVVTSDREIVGYAEKHGAQCVDSAEFEGRMRAALYTACDAQDIEDEEADGWMPTTKKKGPASRTSRRVRTKTARTKRL